MLETPLITVIVPTYNSSACLLRGIKSILLQSFPDFEILIIDGFSTDDTVHIARSFEDARISIFSEKDEGVYDAMNKGIKLASGKWLYFLGSDDQLFNDAVFSKVSAHLKQQNVVYGNAEIIGDTSWSKNGEIYDGPFDMQKLFNKNICHQAIFYNADFIKKNGLFFNPVYSLCGDWDFNLKCRSLTDFQYVDLIIAKFSAGGMSTRTDADPHFSKDMVSNLMSYFKLSPYDPLLDNVNFFRYHEVQKLQKKDNPLRYFTRKILHKLAN